MIQLESISLEKPYIKFKDLFYIASNTNQKNIEAACISSLSQHNEVNSRFVNIKSIIGENFIFFSNYKSPKAKEFENHNQIAVTFFWNKINIQIRLRAIIKKTSRNFNNKYFSVRDERKNALAISSHQSKEIKSYQEVKENYLRTLQNKDLKKCPDYWGGYSFTPYYFEFWEGHESRINKRLIYKKINQKWKKGIIQP